MFESIKKDFNVRTLVLIPIAIAINIAIGQLVYILKLPVYLDSIGTVLVGALAGPWAGALTGALANLLWGILPVVANPYSVPFFYVAAVIGLMAGIAGRWGVFEKESPRWLSVVVGAVFFFTLAFFILAFTHASTDASGVTSYPSAANLLSSYAIVFVVAIIIGAVIGYFLLQKGGYAGLAGLATGVVAAIISAPTAAFVFGGVTGAGTDLLVAAFRASGGSILASVMAQGSVSDPFDKMLSYMVVWLILRSLPLRFRAH